MVDEAVEPVKCIVPKSPPKKVNMMRVFKKNFRNVNDVELDCLTSTEKNAIIPIDAMPVSSEEHVTIEACVDSGAGQTVGPKGLFKMFPLKPSPGSIAGQHYVSATKHRVPNLGERKVKFKTEEGDELGIVVQETDIGELFISVDKLVDNGNEVNLTRKNPHIWHVKTGRITKLYRRRGQFMFKMHVKTKGEPVFSRQGS